MIDVTLIRDPFRATREAHQVSAVEPMTAAEVIEALPDVEVEGSRWAIIHRGRRVGLDAEIAPRDQVVIGRVPAGAFIGLIVFSLISALISFGISLLIQHLMGKPDPPQTGDGATYGFGGIRNTETQGTQIPAIFGRHRVAGQVLTRYRRCEDSSSTTQYLYLLIGLGIGQLNRIGDLQDDADDLRSSGEFLDTFDADDDINGTQLSDRGGWRLGPLQTGDNDIKLQGWPADTQADYQGTGVRLTILDEDVGLGATNCAVSFRPSQTTTDGNCIGGAINAQNRLNFHVLYATSTTNLRLASYVNGTATTLANISGANLDQLCTLERDGDDLNVYINGVVEPAGPWTADANLNSAQVGVAGITISTGDNRISEFGATTANRLPTDLHLNGNPANSYNNVIAHVRMGREGNRALPAGSGFDQVIFGQRLQLPITQTWATYEFSTTIAGFQLVVEFPSGLFLSNENGLGVVSVFVDVQFKINAEAPWSSTPGAPFQFTHGKTAPFARTIFLDTLPAYAIRVRRTTPSAEDTSGTIKDRCVLADVNEITGDTTQTYDGIALMALQIEAQTNLSGGVPNVTNVVEGLAVPTWDGVTGGAETPELVYTWSQNPAWIALGIMLDAQYGLAVPLSDIDIESFKTWADWNDEILDYAEASTEPEYITQDTVAANVGDTSVRVNLAVTAENFAQGDAIRVEYENPNQVAADPVLDAGKYRIDLAFPIQGTYPAGWTLNRLTLGERIQDTRNEFNGVFDSEVGVWEALLRVCRVGRGVPVKEGRKWRIRYEDVGEVVQHISDANMVEGSLEISYAGSGDVPDILEAQYLDEAANWDQDIAVGLGVTRPDPTRIPKRQTISLYGITGARQARREAEFRLRAQALLSKRVTFRVTLDSLAVQAGDIIDLGLTMPGYGIWAGRCRGTIGQIVVDSRVVLPASTNVKATVRNGSDRAGTEVNILSPAGTYEAGDTILSDGGTTALVADATVTLSYTGSRSTLWRVVQTALRDDLTVEVEAIQYEPTVYLLPPPPEPVDPWVYPDCMAPGVYLVDLDALGLNCPEPAWCAGLPADECCCFDGVCTITITGPGASCVEIISVVGLRVIIRVSPGCEGLEFCFNVVCNGEWYLFACCDDEGFNCPDAINDVFCVSNLAEVCSSDEQLCITLCPSAFSSGFDNPSFT